MLIKSGILLDDDPRHGPPATLTWNDSGKFEDRWVRLDVDGTEVRLPRRHRNNVSARRPRRRPLRRPLAAVLDELEQAGQLVLRVRAAAVTEWPRRDRSQAPADAAISLVPYPDNPNGAERNVAGMCDATGRVFGLMPHPERHVDPTHHPRWTRGEAKTPGDGLQVFENAVAYFR